MELLAEEMARQMSQYMHESLGKTLDDHGQTINLQGQPLGPESVLAMFEKIRMEFDDAGNPVGLSVVLAPAMAEQWISVQKQIEGDPALQQRFNDLFDRKRGASKVAETATEWLPHLGGRSHPALGCVGLLAALAGGIGEGK